MSEILRSVDDLTPYINVIHDQNTPFAEKRQAIEFITASAADPVGREALRESGLLELVTMTFCAKPKPPMHLFMACALFIARCSSNSSTKESGSGKIYRESVNQTFMRRTGIFIRIGELLREFQDEKTNGVQHDLAYATISMLHDILYLSGTNQQIAHKGHILSAVADITMKSTDVGVTSVGLNMLASLSRLDPIEFLSTHEGLAEYCVEKLSSFYPQEVLAALCLIRTMSRLVSGALRAVTSGTIPPLLSMFRGSFASQRLAAVKLLSMMIAASMPDPAAAAVAAAAAKSPTKGGISSRSQATSPPPVDPDAQALTTVLRQDIESGAMADVLWLMQYDTDSHVVSSCVTLLRRLLERCNASVLENVGRQAVIDGLLACVCAVGRNPKAAIRSIDLLRRISGISSFLPIIESSGTMWQIGIALHSQSDNADVVQECALNAIQVFAKQSKKLATHGWRSGVAQRCDELKMLAKDAVKTKAIECINAFKASKGANPPAPIARLIGDVTIDVNSLTPLMGDTKYRPLAVRIISRIARSQPESHGAVADSTAIADFLASMPPNGKARNTSDHQRVREASGLLTSLSGGSFSVWVIKRSLVVPSTITPNRHPQLAANKAGAVKRIIQYLASEHFGESARARTAEEQEVADGTVPVAWFALADMICGHIDCQRTALQEGVLDVAVRAIAETKKSISASATKISNAQAEVLHNQLVGAVAAISAVCWDRPEAVDLAVANPQLIPAIVFVLARPQERPKIYASIALAVLSGACVPMIPRNDDSFVHYENEVHNSANQDTLAKAGVLDAASGPLMDDTRTALQGMLLLRALCFKNSTNAIHVVKKGIIAKLEPFLTNPNVELCVSALAALCSVYRGACGSLGDSMPLPSKFTSFRLLDDLNGDFKHEPIPVSQRMEGLSRESFDVMAATIKSSDPCVLTACCAYIAHVALYEEQGASLLSRFGLLRPCVKLLRSPFPDVRGAAAFATAALCSGEGGEANAIAFQNGGVISALCAIADDPKSQPFLLSRCADALGGIFSWTKTHTGTGVQQGVKALTDMIRGGNPKADLAASVCWALSQAPEAAVRKNDSLRVAKGLMDKGDLAVPRSAAAMIERFCRTDTGILLTSVSGCVQGLLTLVSSADDDTRAFASHAATSISLHTESSDDMRSELYRRVTNNLKGSLRESRSEIGRLSAACCIGRAAKMVSCTNAIKECDGLAALCTNINKGSAMAQTATSNAPVAGAADDGSDGDDDDDDDAAGASESLTPQVVAACCYAVGMHVHANKDMASDFESSFQSISDLASQALVVRSATYALSELCVVEEVVGKVVATGAMVKCCLCLAPTHKALPTALTAVAGAAMIDSRGRMAIVAAGVIPNIAALVKHKDPLLRAKATEALGGVALNGAEALHAISMSNAIAAILGLLCPVDKVSMVVEAAAAAIDGIARMRVGRELLVANNALSVLLRTLIRAEGQQRVFVCFALGTLARDRDSMKQLLEAGFPKHLPDLLQAPKTEQVLRAAEMFREFAAIPEGRVIVAKTKGVFVLVSLLDDMDGRVASAAAGALSFVMDSECHGVDPDDDAMKTALKTVTEDVRHRVVEAGIIPRVVRMVWSDEASVRCAGASAVSTLALTPSIARQLVDKEIVESLLWQMSAECGDAASAAAAGTALHRILRDRDAKQTALRCGMLNTLQPLLRSDADTLVVQGATKALCGLAGNGAELNHPYRSAVVQAKLVPVLVSLVESTASKHGGAPIVAACADVLGSLAPLQSTGEDKDLALSITAMLEALKVVPLDVEAGGEAAAMLCTAMQRLCVPGCSLARRTFVSSGGMAICVRVLTSCPFGNAVAACGFVMDTIMRKGTFAQEGVEAALEANVPGPLIQAVLKGATVSARARAAAAVGSLGRCSAHVRNEAAEQGIALALEPLLRVPTPYFVSVCGARAVAGLCVDERICAIIVSCGLIAPLVDLLNVTSPRAQAAAACALAVIAPHENGENRHLISDAGGLIGLLDVIRPTGETIAAAAPAIKSLVCLLQDERCREECLAANGAVFLSKHVSLGVDAAGQQVVIDAVKALGVLARSTSCRVAIGATDVLPKLVDLLDPDGTLSTWSHANGSVMTEAALGCLAALCADVANATLAMRAGAAPAVVRLLESRDPLLVLASLAVLWSAAQRAAHRSQIMECNALEPLLGLASDSRDGYEPIRCAAFGVLGSLLFDKLIMNAALQLGLARLLVDALQASDGFVAVKAAICAHQVSDSHQAMTAMLDEGLLSVLLALCDPDALPMTANVPAAGMTGPDIWGMQSAESEVGWDVILRRRVGEMVVTMTKTMSLLDELVACGALRAARFLLLSTDSMTQGLGAEVVIALSVKEKHKEAATAAGVVRPCVDILRSHEPTVLVPAISALRNLASWAPNKPAIADAGGAAYITKLLYHPSHVVQTNAAATLRLVSSHADGKMKAGVSGAERGLVTLLSTGVVDTQVQAAGALAKMATHARSGPLAIKHGALAPLAKAAESDDKLTALQATKALTILGAETVRLSGVNPWLGGRHIEPMRLRAANHDTVVRTELERQQAVATVKSLLR